MTAVNGLRLAYRGMVAGLAAGYVWLATAMLLALAISGDPLRPLRAIATAVTPLATGSSELALALGFAGVQLAGGLVGMCFAYFFARFFTVRITVATAAPCVALLAWVLLAGAAGAVGGQSAALGGLVPLAATIGYGLLLGQAVPVRGEVERYSGSPST